MSRLTRLAAAVTAALILTTGCSGRPANPPSPQSAREDPNSAPADLVRIVACFRAHGLPNYPDPQYDPSDERWHFPGNQPPLTRAVRQACASLMPQATPASLIPTAQLGDLLNYAICVRAHGLPDWPRPGGGRRVPHGDRPEDRLRREARDGRPRAVPRQLRRKAEPRAAR